MSDQERVVMRERLELANMYHRKIVDMLLNEPPAIWAISLKLVEAVAVDSLYGGKEKWAELMAGADAAVEIMLSKDGADE